MLVRRGPLDPLLRWVFRPSGGIGEACRARNCPNSKNRDRLFRMTRRFLQVALLAFLSSGCAAIFAGKGRSVQIDSSPQGARVLVNGFDRGETPVGVALYPQDEIHLELEGYSSHILKIGEDATQINPPFYVGPAFGAVGVGLMTLSEPVGASDRSIGPGDAGARLGSLGFYFMSVGISATVIDLLFGNMHRVAFDEISIQLNRDDQGKPEGSTGG